MLLTTTAVRSAGLAIALTLQAAILALPAERALAQASVPEPTRTTTDAVDAGDGWEVSVQSTTLRTTAAPGDQPRGPGVLVTTLQVRNTGLEARGFPTYRLHVVNGSGTQQPDTWCGRDTPSLELQPPVAPGATAVGAGCWTVDAADAANLVLYLDAPLGQGAGQPLTFGLTPTVRAEPPTAAGRSANLATPSDSPLAGPGAIDPHVPVVAADSSAPASSAQCSPAYSLYADPSGGYGVSGCGQLGSSAGAGGLGSGVGGLGSAHVGSGGGSGAALRTAGVPPCQLYPSANQRVNIPTASGPVSSSPGSISLGSGIAPAGTGPGVGGTSASNTASQSSPGGAIGQGC